MKESPGNSLPDSKTSSPESVPTCNTHRETLHSTYAEFICRLQPDGSCAFANEALCRFLGMHPRDIIGTPFTPGMLSDDRLRLQKQLHALTPQRPTLLFDYRAQLPDGSRRRVLWSIAALFNKNESLAAYHATGRVVDALMTMREDLSNTHHILRGVFEGINEPLFMIDEHFTLLMLNQATWAYYGAPEVTIDGRTCFQILKGSDSVCEHCTVMGFGDPPQHGTFERASPVNADSYEQVTLYPLEADDKQPRRVIVHIKNLTELKLLQKRVIHAERLASLGTLISGIAHEINNPNNFISLNIPVLREYLNAILPIVESHASGHPDFKLFGMAFSDFKHDLCALLDNMAHGSERINRTVTGLRTFIRNRDTHQIVKTSIPEVIQHAAALCGSRIKQTCACFSVDVADDVPLIRTDPQGLEHILIILLVNAAEALDKHDSRIGLRARRSVSAPYSVIVEVSDNGCGIAPEHREKICNPFFTTKQSSGGTGLGLYICREILEAVNGAIDILSSPGEGTTVRIKLPDIEA